MNTWIFLIGLAACGGIGVAYYTSTIRWYVALPAVLAVALLAMAVQTADANANVRQRWSVHNVECYRYSVTEYRDGVTFGLLGSLWHVNQRLDWCQTPGGSVWEGPVVHRSHGTDAFWVFDNYQAKTAVKKLLHPTRWQVYVKAALTGSPDLYGVAEHNYPWIRMTIWKNNPQHVAYSARCGC